MDLSKHLEKADEAVKKRNYALAVGFITGPALRIAPARVRDSAVRHL